MLLEQLIARDPYRARRHLLTAKKETSDFYQGRVCVYVCMLIKICNQAKNDDACYYDTRNASYNQQ
jgi:hypothetical protein